MSLLQRFCKTLGIFIFTAAFPALLCAQSQSGYVTNGVEYAPAGNLPGDQTRPDISLNASGGFLVWEDNITDGSGLGISAVRLDSSFSPTLGNFRVNAIGADDQENPRVALLKGGGAVFVWQGGKQSFQHIYARFLSASNTWITDDIMVNATTNYFQQKPAVAVLTNGNVIVTWSSRGQDNTDGFEGIYAQLMTPTGTKIGTEFQVNQFTPWNQRTPAVASLANGNFVIAWVSEQETALLRMDIYARLFASSGTPLTNVPSEFRVNISTNVCANPAVAGAADGTFVVTWCQKDVVNLQNSWDVLSRWFTSAGAGAATAPVVNTQLFGDQYAPRISGVAGKYLVVWTSLGQDGSREGVFGQFLQGNGTSIGQEFQVNTTILNQQMHPVVASDGNSRFLVAWSSFVGGVNSMDIYAQRYAPYQAPLSPPGPPLVSALESYALSVSWPPLAGFSVDHWQLYVDTNTTPVLTTNIFWQNESLNGPYTNDYNPGSTHTFQLAYVLTDGRVSPLSATATGKTWGADRNFDGLPDDWETQYYGTNKANWPNANTLLAPGVTVLMVFEWGANPHDPSTWLRTTIQHNYQGWFLSWNTVPGFIYQVQTSTDLVNWSNLGGPRFAAGTTDTLYLGMSEKGYYRVTRLMY